MCRPLDGLCACCHHALPEEACRTQLTCGTDICASCAEAKLRRLMSNKKHLGWVQGWAARMYGLAEVAETYMPQSHAYSKRLHN